MNKYKLNFAEIKQNASGNWLSIFEQCGLSVIPQSGATHATCPICGGTGCFRVDDRSADRTYVCKCGAGDGFKLLKEALSISNYEAFKRVHDVQNGGSYEPVTANRPAPSINKTVNNGDKLARVMQYSSRTPTSEALAYYRSRGIACSGVKHDFVSYGYQWYMGRKILDNDNKPTKHHAILPRLSFFGGVAIGAVRIYTEVQKIQALLPQEKLAKKPVLKGAVDNIRGTGIWFTKKPMRVLHVAEGFENGLSIATALKTTSVVCGNTASGLASLIIPDFIYELHIWSDNGTAGLKASKKLEARYDDVIDIVLHIPPQNKDWNDVLINDKSAILKEFNGAKV